MQYVYLTYRTRKMVGAAATAKAMMDFEYKNIKRCLENMMRSIFGCFKGENVFNGYFRERSGESAC